MTAAALAVGLLAGCGGGGGDATPADPEGVAKTAAGCPAATSKPTSELFVRAEFSCNGQDLYVFNNTEGRDSWSKVAATFGAAELRRGDTWILARAS